MKCNLLGKFNIFQYDILVLLSIIKPSAQIFLNNCKLKYCIWRFYSCHDSSFECVVSFLASLEVSALRLHETVVNLRRLYFIVMS